MENVSVLKPDVILTQATHCDFPMFRYQLRRYRNYFNKVIISFSYHYIYPSLVQFVKDVMRQDDIDFVEVGPYKGKKDWRDIAVNRALDISKSDYVLFFEQDFIVKNIDLYNQVFSQSNIVMFQENSISRYHPAFLLIARDVIDKTSRDFSAKPPSHDHFGQIYEDIKEIPVSSLESLGLTSPNDWEHLAGLTQNYLVLSCNRLEQIYQRDRFIRYNQEILELDIEHHPKILEMIKKGTSI